MKTIKSKSKYEDKECIKYSFKDLLEGRYLNLFIQRFLLNQNSKIEKQVGNIRNKLNLHSKRKNKIIIVVCFVHLVV